jgi:omega-6 fatty acid desaturase (delta-12 desaturase)
MLKPYAMSERARSIFQLVNSFALYFAGWLLTLWLVDISYPLALLASIPTAGFLVRLFIIFHDCGHGSFFRSRRANSIVGATIGVLTLTPYRAWRRRHAAHHANTGNLDDERNLGAINTLTVTEYRALSRGQRIMYRIYRNPLVLFGIGSVLHIAVIQRIPQKVPRSIRNTERRSILWTNLSILICMVVASYLVGWRHFLMVQIPITWISAAIGMWLFFVQHQFENTYFQHGGEWNYHAASLYGSSHYDLPRVLHWFTGNIGFHHIHHLNSRIPNYRLKKCLDENALLDEAPRLGLLSSLRCASLALWDEQKQILVRFKDAWAEG